MTGGPSSSVTHSSHWGAFTADVQDGRLIAVRRFEHDPCPSPLLNNFLGPSLDQARVLRPAIRRGWLQRTGPSGHDSSLRGSDRFIEVPWDEALDLLADELRRVRAEHGASAVFGGSYGWASAGRFHHAQSQIHRFLNVNGGYTGSVNSYSQGASSVVLPHVLGVSVGELLETSTDWKVIEQHTELLVAFGGMPLKNADVCGGGTGEHNFAGHLRNARAAGAQFVLISPQRTDLPEWVEAEWLAIEPGTDTALMLALAYVLDGEGLADASFLAQYCVGHELWLDYVRGRTDGVAKTPAWAFGLTGIPGDRIVSLARRMASRRTLLNTSWSLQRSWYGEQPVWASVALAALLGQIGLPGGGVGHGYGMTASTGEPYVARMPSLAQGTNAITNVIPVARIADMLLSPGGAYEFNGQHHRYPDIRLVYWCGGNPFHHHQDLNRLREAFTRPETIVVHEPWWTATAKHADIVLPVTTTLERNDIGCSAQARHVFAMQQAMSPVGEARSDFAVFSNLSARLGTAQEFTEGRGEREWLEHLYEKWRRDLPAACGRPPIFADFWKAGWVRLQPAHTEPQIFLSPFRRDPVAHPLRTPSGRIEITSATVAGFGYDDCPGHPVWREPPEWRGAPLAARFPLVLIANNPATRLHSQLDAGACSAASKVGGREPVRLHPVDAGLRGIVEGAVVRLHNERGSLLAGAVIDDALKPGVVQLATGAWLDWQQLDAGGQRPTCVHGNPNVLTADAGSSRLSQGCVGQVSLVEVELHLGASPPQCAWRAQEFSSPQARHAGEED